MPGTEHYTALNINKKFELMLMRRARAYSSFMFAGNIGLSLSISSQFTLLQPKIASNH